MANFDYSLEPKRDILFIDVKSFYASVECAMRGYDPLTTMLVVMSTSDNTGNGLILASSPMAKKVLGISNVTRANNLPNHPDLIKVPPRMNLYVHENMKINRIFKKYVADEDWLPYSIDESVIDVTASLNLFVPDPDLNHRQKRWRLARIIQRDVYKQTGLYVTIGIGDNLLLAKLAMDNEAKHNRSLLAEWRYEDVESKVWNIPEITDFWGISSRTKARLYRLGVDTVKQLANLSPYQKSILFNGKSGLGAIGNQLYHHANGIDRTILSEESPQIKEKSYGNSQVLPKTYIDQIEIEVVVKEMAEQVASRIRRHGCLTQCVSLFIGASRGEDGSFHHQMKIPATNNTRKLSAYCIDIFRKHYRGQPIRHVGVTYSRLVFTDSRQLNLFESPEKLEAEEHLDQIIDRIRAKYGFTAIVHATSALEGARSIKRAGLVGGHDGGSAGGLDGL
ncbi:Y-family DNA polymerase [Enterococcus asini]|uniref:Y-family DNA polymerase n=1 Tax=Enterococcus asini TaxID=57732 RepID=UPI0028915733|nr:Y-family DNA polymerase [Enterococcus asini]MDT2756988.1 Y-family DNA polymerase [Enterococcus asini]